MTFYRDETVTHTQRLLSEIVPIMVELQGNARNFLSVAHFRNAFGQDLKDKWRNISKSFGKPSSPTTLSHAIHRVKNKQKCLFFHGTYIVTVCLVLHFRENSVPTIHLN